MGQDGGTRLQQFSAQLTNPAAHELIFRVNLLRLSQECS